MSRKRPIASAKRTRTARTFDEVPKKSKVVLLSCGSFNPVTNMHLRMFELARDHLEDTGRYEVVKGILSPVGDGYKKIGLIEASHRVEMAKLAVESSSWIEVDSWESRQADWQETVKVLRHQQQELLSQEPDTDVVGTAKPGRKRKRMDASSATKRRKLEEPDIAPKKTVSAASSGEPRVMLLCGADVLESFGVPGLWKPQHIEEIASTFGLVCITRGGSDAEAFIQGSDLLLPHRSNIHVVQEWVANDVSATRIRHGLRCGHSVRYLLPDPVLGYIQERQLYNAESEQRNEGVVLAPLQKCARTQE
ncbi:nicotinamide/nicotinic acid mononucleotide adenylyltransferase 1-like [Brienomyrus brachyistius]|uniref:nicotinamide/nicotinic acid mononucleotide adenylyltransferase 1-like n=1 Tax=Brienomyrus brachyistius TaxID=42636 RepID=UPI0020B384C4|nr:nicotinamide/nicotinic acid mononucleotide adenylyltransferase 1-like [Brienomyrus brachyistius]XP_048858921.1 nicotinamide/nicotinic acid mononucleotide adenylyltransferase 1-like [Brienomyrus brachyistius]XP_048860917.1 nicotinamide/nicotinic acid mononucleotide adenylyltransferase 1-like [Brienomyrus brachyistius]XP_048860918.1 nicotinamide/nicotinic acid mononucleotide adenylyltransferase 1-like [Brienomyrus brachyistius]XP_048860919.1 nicotinamide/nicotinic acid mononucleotide adenylylt